MHVTGITCQKFYLLAMTALGSLLFDAHYSSIIDHRFTEAYKSRSPFLILFFSRSPPNLWHETLAGYL